MPQGLTSGLARPSAGRGEAVNDMVEMFVYKVGTDPANRALVILQDTEQRRLLPIWIGHFEAQAIAWALSNAQHERPFTHDLLCNVIRDLGHEIERIEVTKLEDNTFYAEIAIAGPDGRRYAIDSRPSDAIALAVRTRAPIFVAQDVLDQAELLTEEAEQDEMETFRRLMSNVPVASEGTTGTEEGPPPPSGPPPLDEARREPTAEGTDEADEEETP